MTKNTTNKLPKSDLDTLNPNHLKYKHGELFFEVLGGVNTESYMMLRVMLVVRANRLAERDHIDLYNNYQLTTFIKKVAERTNISLKNVEAAFQELIDELEAYKHQQIEQKQTKQVVLELDPLEEQAAKEQLGTPELLANTQTLIQQTGVVGNEQNSLTLYLLYMSRFQTTPLHAIVQSKYHYLQNKIGELVPPEHKKQISHLSDNALFYFEKEELSHKLLQVEDTGNNKKKLQPLLELQHKNSLTKTVTQKDKDGYLRTVQRTVRGPICLSISTPKEQHFINNAVLSFVLTEDQSAAQDERIMNYQRKQSAGLVEQQKEQAAKTTLWNMQRILQPIKAINPFAQNIVLPQELKNKQLSNAHYLRFIEVITHYKQYQKEQLVDEQTGEVYIQTTIEDIEQANQLLGDLLVKKCDGLNSPTRNYLEALKNMLTKRKQTTFTNASIHLAMNIPISTVKRYHAALLSKGYIEPTGEGDRAKGYEYTIKDKNEYEQLKKKVKQNLNKNISTLKKLKLSPQPTVAQNKNGLPKTSNNSVLNEVAHKFNKVSIKDNDNPIKKVG